MQNHYVICPPCRKAYRTATDLCLDCGKPTTVMSRNWRPPKKNNLRAWKRVAAGDIYWENSVIDRRNRLRPTGLLGLRIGYHHASSGLKPFFAKQFIREHGGR